MSVRLSSFVMTFVVLLSRVTAGGGVALWCPPPEGRKLWGFLPSLIPTPWAPTVCQALNQVLDEKKQKAFLHFRFSLVVVCLLQAHTLLSREHMTRLSCWQLFKDRSPSKSVRLSFTSGSKPSLAKVATVSLSFLGESAFKAKRPFLSSGNLNTDHLRLHFCFGLWKYH